METPAAQPVQPQDGVSNATIFTGTAFILALAAIGYYLIERSKNVPPVISPNQNVPIPGIQNSPTQNPGARAVGVLTDPNFFSGLTNMATTIADLVNKNKNRKGQYEAPATGSAGNTSNTFLLQPPGTFRDSGGWGGW